MQSALNSFNFLLRALSEKDDEISSLKKRMQNSHLFGSDRSLDAQADSRGLATPTLARQRPVALYLLMTSQPVASSRTDKSCCTTARRTSSRYSDFARVFKNSSKLKYFCLIFIFRDNFQKRAFNSPPSSPPRPISCFFQPLKFS